MKIMWNALRSARTRCRHAAANRSVAKQQNADLFQDSPGHYPLGGLRRPSDRGQAPKRVSITSVIGPSRHFTAMQHFDRLRAKRTLSWIYEDTEGAASSSRRLL